MNTSELHKRSYREVLVLRLLIGLIRFIFDIPSFFRFLVSGEVEPRTHHR